MAPEPVKAKDVLGAQVRQQIAGVAAEEREGALGEDAGGEELRDALR